MTLIVEGNETLECLRAAAAFGFREAEFFNGRAIDLCSQKVAINKGMPSTDGPKDSLAFVSSAGPTDTVQSSLAVQMKATHDSAMVVLQSTCPEARTEAFRLYTLGVLRAVVELGGARSLPGTHRLADDRIEFVLRWQP